MDRHAMRPYGSVRVIGLLAFCVAASLAVPSDAEDIFHEQFEGPPRKDVFQHSWGDRPSTVVANVMERGIGVGGSSGVILKLEFSTTVENNLSYWNYSFAEQVPLVPQLESISLSVKTNVPISLKVAIAPYGFIYHGPAIGPSPKWQDLTLTKAYDKLKDWCIKGNQPAEGAWISSVIVAVGDTKGAKADMVVDNIVMEGPAGAKQAVRDEALRRRTRKVRIAPISLVWDQGNRTLEKTLAALDEAGMDRADLACLPEVCVDQPPESIPGPTSAAIARKAAQHKMYVVGNLREKDGQQWYVTSFLCDRQGKLVGKYRKSHCLPYEQGPGSDAGFTLGDDLPVLATDIGPIGLTIGTDHYFPEIDVVLRRRGASLILWSTSPFPVRDEHTITLSLQGRAVDNGLHYAVARYAGLKGYGGYDNAFSWTATWPLGRAQVFDSDGHTVADSGHAGGVAVATVLASRLTGSIGTTAGYGTEGKYALITASKDKLPAPFARKSDTKRAVRVAAIEYEPSIDRLITKLDACGRERCDLACLWEYVWYHNDAEAEKNKERNRQWLARVAEAAKRNRMYVVIAGELERGFNESILFDREGREIDRYTKIIQTTPKESRYYREGDRVGVYDLDFGRICTKICADVYAPEIDRVAALHQVDVLLHHTQDAGPFVEHTRLRDYHRAVDAGYFALRSVSQVGSSDHRSYIMDPWGMVLGSSQHGTDNAPVLVTLQLDNRPKYFEWPAELRKKGPYPDGYQQGKRPLVSGDLREVILKQRRPKLYEQR